MSTKRTPLYDRHVKANAQIVEYSGWEMPIKYTSLNDEHQAVRNRAGLFDVSHMGEIYVQGPQAEEFINYVFSNNVSKLEDNAIIYGFFLNPQGGVVDDLLVYKVNKDYYILIVNAANTDKDFDWLKQHVDGYDVSVDNHSSEIGQIAIQGPLAQEILQKLVEIDLNEIKPFRFVDDIPLVGTKALISRTGYTGEDGFEIYTPAEDIAKVWDALIEAGGENISPAGLGCRDTLRFEASMPLYGNEMDDEISPLFAGLGFFISKEGSYIGSEAIAKMREEGLKYNLIGLEVTGRGIARAGYPVYDEDGNEVGVVTTGYQSPTLGKAIANARVSLEDRSEGREIFVGIRGKKVPAKIVSRRYLNNK